MYTDDDKALILLECASLSYKKKEALLSLAAKPSGLLYNFESLQKEIIKAASKEVYENLLNLKNSDSIERAIKSLTDKNIQIVTIYSKDYPNKLKEVESPPYLLYCMGDIRLLKSKCFAIVGTRHITNYGKIVTEKFSKGLCAAGFTIVSGLTAGVDTVAHTTALENNGKTIAVLAGGFDKIYPVTNFQLSKEIEKFGLLVSENPPKSQVFKFMFPMRNRIIAGLSDGVLITEAGDKSGAMHTKNYAIDAGREVFAVPGNITSLASVGTNRLILNSHAMPVVDVNDILNVYNMQIKLDIPVVKSENNDENMVMHLLKSGEKTFEEIVELTKFDAKKLNTLLTTMAIRGLIKKLAGNLYTINQ